MSVSCSSCHVHGGMHWMGATVWGAIATFLLVAGGRHAAVGFGLSFCVLGVTIVNRQQVQAIC